MGNFRRVHVFARFDEFGQVTKTYISINDPTNNDSLSAEVAGDYRNESESVCVQAVLDDFYKRNYADKAMAESVRKVDELERLISGFRLEMAELKEVTLEEIRAEAQAKSDKLENAVKIAVMTINQMLLDMEDDNESDDLENGDE